MKITKKLGIAAALLAATASVLVLVTRSEQLTLPEALAAVPEEGPRAVAYPANAPQLSSLRTEPAALLALPIAEPVNARIAYDENLTARISSPVTGRVTRLLHEIGDPVPAGTPLLSIDSADLAAAEADSQKARIDERRKKLAHERASALFEREVIARKDHELAEADWQQAAAEARRAEQRLKLFNASAQGSRQESGLFTLKSPIAGVVAERSVNPGMEVRPDLQNPLYVVSDVRRLWVLADVPERLLGEIKPGQATSVVVDAYPNQSFPATVERVGLALDPGTRRVQVRCVVANADGRLKPEMFARIYFLAERQEKGVRVPNSALVVEGLYTHVFVESKPGRFERRRVNLARRGPDASFIEAGSVNEGDRVVTHGALLLNAEVGSHAR